LAAWRAEDFNTEAKNLRQVDLKKSVNSMKFLATCPFENAPNIPHQEGILSRNAGSSSRVGKLGAEDMNIKAKKLGQIDVRNRSTES
jgi:hypothetical protein